MPDPRTAAVSKRTLQQVEQHLEALGSPSYDLLVVDAPSGQQRHFRTHLTAQEVLEATPWLHQENLREGEILFRPSDRSEITFLRNVKEPAVRSGEHYGLEPAAVIRRKYGQHELWLRSGELLHPDEKARLDRMLASDFEVEISHHAPTQGFGHLAGFTSPLTQKRAGLEEAPYLALESTSGRVFSKAPALIAAARQFAAEASLRLRTDREVEALQGDKDLSAALDEADRRRGLGPALSPSIGRSEVEEGVARLSLAREAHEQARLEFRIAFELGGPPLPREEQLRLAEALRASYRGMRQAERPLEDLLGIHPLPPHLALDDVPRYLELRTAAHEAETYRSALGRDRRADPTARDEAEVAAQLHNDALARFETERQLPRSVPYGQLDPDLRIDDELPLGEPQLPPTRKEAGNGGPLHGLAGTRMEAGTLDGESQRLWEACSSAENAYRFSIEKRLPASEQSACLAAMTRAEIELESFEFKLRGQVHVLGSVQDQISEKLARLEPLAERDPTNHLAPYERAAEQLIAVEDRIEILERELVRLERGRLAREQRRVEDVLVVDPSDENLKLYAQLYDRYHSLGPNDSPNHFDAPLTKQSQQSLQSALQNASRRVQLQGEELIEMPSRRNLDYLREALEKDFSVRLRAGDAALRRDSRAAQVEMRASLAEIGRYVRSSREVPPHVLDRFRDALALRNAAETAYAARIDRRTTMSTRRHSHEVVESLGQLLRGDLTPETLSRLNRHLAVELKRRTGLLPAPEVPKPAKKDLAAAIAAQRGDRLALLRSARAVSSQSRSAWLGLARFARDLQDRTAPGALEHLQKAVARYQASASHLNRLATAYTLGPLRRVLPVAYFLEHPRFKHAPHRAVRAWTAHALRQGLPGHQASEILARTSRTRIATPGIRSSRFGSLAAALAGRWLARLPERAMLEYVHHDR